MLASLPGLKLGTQIEGNDIESIKVSLFANISLLECVAGRFRVTPFLRACIHGRLEILQFLVDQGCNVTAKDSDLYTGAHLAAMYGHIQVLDYLYGLCPDLFSHTQSQGKTPLVLAIEGNYEETAVFLIDKCDVNQLFDRTQSALSLAISRRLLILCKKLLEQQARITHEVLAAGKNSSLSTWLISTHKFLRIKSFLFTFTYAPGFYLSSLPISLKRELIINYF